MSQMHAKPSFLENDDDCVTAGDIYSCGKEKEPAIVDAIFNTEKGNGTMVYELYDFTKYY